MNKLINAMCLTIVLCAAVFAQNSSDDEYKKNEFYVGYSNQQIDAGNFRTFNGFEASAVRNFNRYFGIKVGVSGAYRNEDFQGTVQTSPTTSAPFRSEVRSSLYNFLGGVQVKDNASEARFKPFGHALAGVAHSRAKFRNSLNNIPAPDSTFTDTGFAAALGGGLDIKINDRIDFRAIQVDYNPIYTNRRFDNNVRIGVGIVFK